MYRRNYYQNDPRWITARYRGRCTCGQEIRPGDRAMYYPLARTTACQNCGLRTDAELADDDLNQVAKIR